MLLYYYKDPVGNFGDDLNEWLWTRLLPRPIERCFDGETLFLGIGTLLNSGVPGYPPKKVVFSSGFGYGAPPIITEDWRFFCVRGPLTAESLGLSQSLAITDGALLLRSMFEPAQQSEYGVAFMPHHWNALVDDWRKVCKPLGIQYIDPGEPVETIIDVIRKSSLVISEAMHGAIVADAFRVPWISVRTRPYIFQFKWRDWAASLQMEHRFEWLPPIWNPIVRPRHKAVLNRLLVPVATERLRWLARYGKRHLSDDRVFDSVYCRLTEAFSALVRAVG